MSRAVNEAIINGLVEEMKDLDSCVLIGPRGLTVEEVTGLRSRLRKRNIKMRVLKNSLAARALEKTAMPGLSELLSGPSALVYGGEGAITISKVIVEEARKTKDKILIHGGFSEGEILDSQGIDSLSKAPTRDEALALVMSNFFAPVSEFARGMEGLLAEVHGLIEALEKKRVGGGDE